MKWERLFEKVAPDWAAGLAGEAVAELIEEECDGDMPEEGLYNLADRLGIRNKERFIETVLHELKGENT